MFVIMSVCLIATPATCKEARVEQSVEERPPIACIVEGQNTVAVWQTEHGHIYVFEVAPGRDALLPLAVRGAPDAAEPAERFADEALRYATREAVIRDMIATATPTQQGKDRSDRGAQSPDRGAGPARRSGTPR